MDVEFLQPHGSSWVFSERNNQIIFLKERKRQFTIHGEEREDPLPKIPQSVNITVFLN